MLQILHFAVSQLQRSGKLYRLGIVQILGQDLPLKFLVVRVQENYQFDGLVVVQFVEFTVQYFPS